MIAQAIRKFNLIPKSNTTIYNTGIIFDFSGSEGTFLCKPCV